MTLAQLEAFYWVVRLGSVQEAARQLNVAQPTISLRIRDLETAIGTKIFQRVGRGLRANHAGETLLVHGSAGGVGLAAVELGKLLGATVIATGSSDDKLAIVKARGADHVINVAQGFREKVKELTGGRGADVVYDPVGGDVFDESVRCIAWSGRFLIIGFASGRIPNLPVNMALIKGFSLIGVRAGEFGRRDPQAGRESIEAIDRLAAEGRIDPYVCAVFPLERAVEAMRMLENRQVVGKVVITMD